MGLDGGPHLCVRGVRLCVPVQRATARPREGRRRAEFHRTRAQVPNSATGAHPPAKHVLSEDLSTLCAWVAPGVAITGMVLCSFSRGRRRHVGQSHNATRLQILAHRGAPWLHTACRAGAVMLPRMRLRKLLRAACSQPQLPYIEGSSKGRLRTSKHGYMRSLQGPGCQGRWPCTYSLLPNMCRSVQYV